MSDTVSFLDWQKEANRPKVEKRAWMDTKVMKLVTVDILDQVVDECIESGLYAWDVETTGLDNRVFFREDGTHDTIDKIVGHCLSPDGVHGYYIPVRHIDERGEPHTANLPLTTTNKALQRLALSKSVAIFHHGKFDHEFLQFGEAVELGEWDDPESFEDTNILAYVRNTRERNKGLKFLSMQELGLEMIELDDLFTKEQLKTGKKNFSLLDPTWNPALWYGCSDAICTYLLFKILHPTVMDPEPHGQSQSTIYQLEKLGVPATRWMERCRIHINRDKVEELIRLGQAEWVSSLEQVYMEASKMLGRDLRPGWFRLMCGLAPDISAADSYIFNPDQLSPDYMMVREEAKSGAKMHRMDPVEVGSGGKDCVRTVIKEVPALGGGRKKEKVAFPVIYDVTIPAQLGQLLRELGVQGLQATLKSGQVKTSRDVLDLVIEAAGAKFPFMGKVKRFRETAKALGTNLFPIWHDTTPERSPDGCVKVSFNAHKIDTGRFATPAPRDKKNFHGQVRWNLHSTPATYDRSRPECMLRIRECVNARPGHVLLAIDYSGVELRIVTNLSREPKWLKEFFRCNGCERVFDQGTPGTTPEAPPSFCPDCGSDKIGDLHSLTAISVYGKGITADPKLFKSKRQSSKSLNFAMCYGGGGMAAQRAVGVDKDEGWRLKRQFDNEYPGLRGWWGEQHRFAERYKYVVTAFGRRYPLPDIDHEIKRFVSKAQRNSVNGPVQGCLHPQCRIPTSDGLKTVQELYERYADGGSFKVWTGQEWSEARPLYSGEKAVCVTEFSSGTTIRTSPEHLFLTWQDPETSPQERGDVLEWLRQRDVSDGNWVAMSTEVLDWPEPKYQWESEKQLQEGHLFTKGMTPHNYKGFSIDGNSEALWEFLGLVYGDGSICPERFDIHVGESKVKGYTGPSAEEIARIYADRLNTALNVRAHVYRKRRSEAESHKKDMWQVQVCNKAFRDFCQEVLGVEDQNPYTKRFPTAVWRESLRNRAAFLRGYFGSDGHASASGDAASVRSVNLGLLRDAHDLLRTLGIRSSFRPKSLRVSVLDRFRFREIVGFTVPHKNERLADITENPWIHQWDLAPPRLIQWVGETVYKSSIYAGLPKKQKSAVLRLKAGSGSRHQCLKYLSKISPAEVPNVLLELLRYDWEQKVSSKDTGEIIEMYDVEVFDDFHAFVADGCIVHNTSADIIKLAMARIYRACKKRGWLRKVLMTITIHDELVFEILDEVAEEAVDVIVPIMTRNSSLLRLKWPIPLKVDIEAGDDWTVPHNLTEMEFNKTSNWTPRLVRTFPHRYASYLQCGGTPLIGFDEPPPTTGGGDSQTPTPQPTSPPAHSDREVFQVPETGKGKIYTHVIHSSRLSLGLMDKLAQIIYMCEGRGLESLRIVTENGDVLWEDLGTVLSATEFKVIAGEHNI